MSLLSLTRFSFRAVLGVLFLVPRVALAQVPLDEERFIEIVLGSHPAAAHGSGLEAAAAAEKKAGRLLPDPVFEYTRDRARATERVGPRETETAYSVSQTIPWPGTFSAGIRAADRAADALRASAETLRWDIASQARRAFARLVASRALAGIARDAESDARSLRDLVTRRADLGESRESDRIKATVEWLRQQRNLAAAEREAESAEAALRMLAVAPLPHPLTLASSTHGPLPPIDRGTLAAQLVETNPRLLEARAEAARREALLSAAHRGRVPDLALTLFKQTELDKTATGFSAGIKVPLWNAGRGEIARSQAGLQVASAEAARVRLELVTELEGRLKELQVAADQESLLERDILPAAERSVALVRLSFEEGETSLLDLLDAQRTLREAQREGAEAHFAFIVALSEAQKLAGPAFNPWR